MIMLKTCLGGSFVILCIRKRIFCVKLGKLIVQNFFEYFLKKGLTKRGFCYILNKSSAMSHQNDSKT